MDYEKLSDEEIAGLLAKASRENDENSFQCYSREIYERFQRQVYKICRYYGLKHADAEDAASDSFIRLFRCAGTYRDGARFKSWFFRIVMNIVRDRYREMKRVSFTDPEAIADIPSDNPHFTNKTHNSLMLERLLSQLPEKLKEAVMLRIYGALDSESIASVVGVSDRQVRNRLEQAYDLLREMGVENDFQH